MLHFQVAWSSETSYIQLMSSENSIVVCVHLSNPKVDGTMQQINLDGSQSFHLNAIKEVLRSGEIVTHILNVKVSKQPTKKFGDRLRSKIFSAIANRAVLKVIDGADVTVTWRTSARKSSAYYHCDATIYNDDIISRHTERMLNELLNGLDAAFDHRFSNGTTGLAYLVSKPLVLAGLDEAEEVLAVANP
jgi:hypothetical protein